MSSPSSETVPASGCSKPAITLRVVVLPEPDGPRSVKNSPAPTCRFTSSTAATPPNCFRIPATPTSAAKAAFQDVEPLLEIGVVDRERREDANHVPVDAAREQQQTLLARLAGDPRGLLSRMLGQFER